MTQDKRFLQDIIEHPGDDTPRLVYSDYLKIEGRPRSVPTSSACSAGWPFCPRDYPRRQELEARERWAALRPRGMDAAGPGAGSGRMDVPPRLHRGSGPAARGVAPPGEGPVRASARPGSPARHLAGSDAGRGDAGCGRPAAACPA